jgi:hypothetical protein
LTVSDIPASKIADVNRGILLPLNHAVGNQDPTDFKKIESLKSDQIKIILNIYFYDKNENEFNRENVALRKLQGSQVLGEYLKKGTIHGLIIAIEESVAPQNTVVTNFTCQISAISADKRLSRNLAGCQG